MTNRRTFIGARSHQGLGIPADGQPVTHAFTKKGELDPLSRLGATMYQ